MNRDDVIRAVDDYSAQSGLKPTTICHMATGNRKIYERLTGGRNPGLRSIERLLDWMRDNPPQARAAE